MTHHDRDSEHDRDQHGRPTWGRAGERPGAPSARDQLSDQGVRRRPSAAVTARAVNSWVDQQIEQAQRQGAFDNLSGAGRPLRDVDVQSEPDWWVKSLVEREQLDLGAAMPGVMQLRREKAGFPGSLADLTDEAAVRARLEDFNERVLADRRRPVAGTSSPPVVGRVDVDELVEAWRVLRGELEGETGEAQARPCPDRSQVASTSADRRPSWWRRLQSRARRASSW